MDHPDPIQEEKQFVVTWYPKNNSLQPRLDLASINTDSPCYQSVLEKVIEIQLKDNGHQKKYLLEQNWDGNLKKLSELMDVAKKNFSEIVCKQSFLLSDVHILELVKEQQTNNNKMQEICD